VAFHYRVDKLCYLTAAEEEYMTEYSIDAANISYDKTCKEVLRGIYNRRKTHPARLIRT